VALCGQPARGKLAITKAKRDQANADVDVDPEWPRLLWNLVDQEPKGA
jgi:hypothetical protein